MTTKNTFREIAKAHIAYVLSADYKGREALTSDYRYRDWLRSIEWHFAELPREDGRYDLTIAIDGDAIVIPVDVSNPEEVRRVITPMAFFRASDAETAQLVAWDRAERAVRDALHGVSTGLRRLKNEDAEFIFNGWGRLTDYYMEWEPEETGQYKVHFWDESKVIDEDKYIDIYDIDDVIQVFNPHYIYYTYVKPRYLNGWTEIEAAAVLSHERTDAKDFFDNRKGRLEVYAWGSDKGTLGEAFKDLADEGMDYLMHDPQTIFYKGYIVADTAAY